MMSTFVDAHAHFHECFSLPAFLDAAVKNIRIANESDRRDNGDNGGDNHDGIDQGVGVSGVLLLCQTSPGDPLAALKARIESLSEKSGGWRFLHPDENAIVCQIQESDHRNETVTIIGGRQIVTNEKLELLSLCSAGSVQGGMSLSDSVNAVVEHNGVPLLPWGFGKWSFQRGKLLREFLQRYQSNAQHQHPLLVGDNGGRAVKFEPRLLREAEALGFPVVSGSDPLPIPDHVNRIGSLGVRLTGNLDLQSPTEWMRTQLLNLVCSPPTFGQYRTLRDFLSDQVRLRLRAK